jgi:hypothetical protein
MARHGAGPRSGGGSGSGSGRPQTSVSTHSDSTSTTNAKSATSGMVIEHDYMRGKGERENRWLEEEEERFRVWDEELLWLRRVSSVFSFFRFCLCPPPLSFSAPFSFTLLHPHS